MSPQFGPRSALIVRFRSARTKDYGGLQSISCSFHSADHMSGYMVPPSSGRFVIPSTMATDSEAIRRCRVLLGIQGLNFDIVNMFGCAGRIPLFDSEMLPMSCNTDTTLQWRNDP